MDLRASRHTNNIPYPSSGSKFILANDFAAETHTLKINALLFRIASAQEF